MTGTERDQLRQAVDSTGRLVAAVGDAQWNDPTPRGDWTVRDLVNHLVIGNLVFARILDGQPMASMDLARLRSADHLGEHPSVAYDDSVAEMVAAFDRPGVMERVVTVPVGPVPGIIALHLRIVEALVHGWDLAQATGRPAPGDDELAEQALRFTETKLADLPPDRSPFGPPQPVAADAPALDRLAACLGRQVTPAHP